MVFLNFVSAGNTCLQPVVKTIFRQRFRPEVTKIHGSRSLEILFPPLVYAEGEAPIQENDHLRCYSDFNDFYKTCPRLRAKSITLKNSCDSVQTNKDCEIFDNTLKNLCTTSDIFDRVSTFSVFMFIWMVSCQKGISAKMTKSTFLVYCCGNTVQLCRVEIPGLKSFKKVFKWLILISYMHQNEKK